MEPILIIAAIIQIVLVVWFVKTLNSIERHASKTADYVRQISLNNPPTEEACRIINRQISIEEVIHELEKAGVRISVGPSSAEPQRLVIENIGSVNPELLRILDDNRFEAIQHLLNRKS